MRKMLTGTFTLTVLALMCTGLSAQEFENGAIDVVLNDYGRIRLYEPLTGGIYVKQLERLSILVGVDSTAVFDYKNDAESEDTARTIESPALSDHELYGAVDYEWSYSPPDVLVKINVYGWNTGGYCIAKYTVINQETETIAAKIGFNFMPVIDNNWYENMTADYYADSDIVYSHRGDSTQLGIKFLSHPLTSCDIMAYEDYSYASDTTLFTYLIHDAIDTEFIAPGEGLVAVPSIDAISLATGDSVEVFLGIAFGGDSTTMVDNMALASSAVRLLAIDAPRSEIPVGYHLSQNYPNPFNPSTTIEFSVSATENVLLNVYDLSGRLVTRLVDDRLLAGPHRVNFSGENLSTGVYFYTLKVGKFSTTRKMILLK
jgi:hypothetical protein